MNRKSRIPVSVFIAAGIVAAFYLFSHFRSNSLPADTIADRILVEKSERKLSIFHHGKLLKTYRVALGRNPVGPKEREGDMKTPEGVYTVDYRNPNSDYHLSLHISYPSAEDVVRAAERGIPAGFDIMIHGLPNGHQRPASFHPQEDWTAGCIAVTDEEIDELWRVTPDGTPIEIVP